MEYGFNKELYPIQKAFIKDAVDTIENNKVGIFSSPTGTGKTLSLLCAATKFMKPTEDDDLFELLNNNDKTKIYYCSRTHSQLSQVINELKTNKNIYSSVVLGSRKVYCVNKDVNKNRNIDIINDNCKKSIKDNSCEYYKNFHYDQRILDIEDLVKLGTEKCFCPYYFSKNKASDCNIVFLPYNLLFNKAGRESLNINLKNKILIIDEAHNIYDTVIELNSVDIQWDDLKTISQINGLNDDLKTILSNLLSFRIQVKLECVFEVLDFLIKCKISNYNMIEMSEFIDKNRLAQKNDMKFVFEFSKFLKLLTYSDDGGRIFADKYKIRFTCINPKLYFDEIKECKSVILAGGTMEPISNLKAIFNDIKYFSYPSVNENFMISIISETVNNKVINLNFINRDEQIDDVINSLIALSNPIASGGIVIFVPSKYFLQSIKRNPRIENFKRKVYFDDDFNFEEFRLNPDILISVMGGVLSEGINFNDDICRLLIIVGVPYPTKNLDFEERSKFNKDHGSIIAMKTVNQTIGRAIRHKNDYAAIVLLDCRFVGLKDKLSPWAFQKTKTHKFVEGLIQINKFLKSQK